MANLTISMEDQLIKKARVRAIQQGTSLSAKVREFLEHYVDGSDDALKKQREASTARLIATMDAATAQTTPDTGKAPPEGKTLRDELYADDFRARDRLPTELQP
jgi:plasmid stability protein